MIVMESFGKQLIDKAQQFDDFYTKVAELIAKIAGSAGDFANKGLFGFDLFANVIADQGIQSARSAQDVVTDAKDYYGYQDEDPRAESNPEVLDENGNPVEQLIDVNGDPRAQVADSSPGSGPAPELERDTLDAQFHEDPKSVITEAFKLLYQSLGLDVTLEDLKKFDTSSFSIDAGWTHLKTIQPPDCDSAENCDWICANFLVKGAIKIDKLTIGGAGSNDYDIRVGELGTRLLEGQGVWEPNQGEAGVQIDVEPINLLGESSPSGQENGDNTDSSPLIFASQAMLVVSALLMILFN